MAEALDLVVVAAATQVEAEVVTAVAVAELTVLVPEPGLQVDHSPVPLFRGSQQQHSPRARTVRPPREHLLVATDRSP